MVASDPDLQALQAQFAAMPPVRAMAIGVEGFVDGALHVRAPLAANINDKQNAFGGSLASLMTLAAWGWLTLRLQQAGLQADVYVADSQLRYLAPVYEDLLASAAPEQPEDWSSFEAALRQRGKARINMAAATVLADGTLAATLAGRFVAIAKAG